MPEERCLNCEHKKEMHSEGLYECGKSISAGKCTYGCICNFYIPPPISQPLEISLQESLNFEDKLK